MPKKKNAAGVALAELSRKKRMQTMTPAQRSAQARKAVMSRRDRQKTGPWYGLVVLPADEIGTGKIVSWSQDKTAMIEEMKRNEYTGRTCLVIEGDRP